MKSSEYWEKRALAREDYTRKLADEALAKKVLPAYERATKQLTVEAQRILHIFAANGEITPAEAQKLLNMREEREVLDSLWKELDSIKDPETRRKVLNRLNAPAYGARISRLEALRAKIYTEMAKISEKEIEQAGRVIEEAYTHTYYRSIYDTQKGTNFAFSFELLPDKAIEAAIFNSWSGHHYSKRVWQNTSLVASEAEKIITSGIISGANVNRMAKQLDDVMQSGKYAAVRLIRTEANHAYNSAELKAYEEEGIEQYSFLATLDNRTCEVCGKLDGKVFNVSEAKVGLNYPPLHPNDRCTTTAHFDGDSFENLKRRARNPETGKNELVPADMTWEQWKKQFPEETFNRKTPPGKYLIPKQDKEQFERYSKTLKELSPKTIESFHEIKYNKPEEWKQLKGLYRYKIRVPEATDDDYQAYQKIVATGVKGLARVPPQPIDVSKVMFNDEHAKNHGCTVEDAIGYIINAKCSISRKRWDGNHTNYYSLDGAAYIEDETQKIKTAFSSADFDDMTQRIVEVFK